MYVVIAVGHEGINHIFWAGADPDEAKAKVLACRQRLAEVLALTEEEQLNTEGPWFSLYDPARICVQKQMEDHRFQCCCKELGVSAEGGPYLY